MAIRKSAINRVLFSVAIMVAALVVSLLNYAPKFLRQGDVLVQFGQLFAGIAAIAVLSFVFGWVRYSRPAGVTLLVASLHDQLLALALTVLISMAFALPVTMPAYVLASSLFTYCFTIPLLRQTRAQLRNAANRDATRQDAARAALNTIKPLVLLVVVAAMLIIIAFLVAGNQEMVGHVLPVFCGLFAAVLSVKFISPFVWAACKAPRKARR